MKKANSAESIDPDSDELLPEYRFDSSKPRPNRFANHLGTTRIVVMLDDDVPKVFTTAESVNIALRALIAVVPKSRKRSKSET